MTRRDGTAMLYGRAGCAPCYALKRLAARAARRHGVALAIVDIAGDARLEAAYGLRVPVLVLPDGAVFEGRVDPPTLERAFREAGSGGSGSATREIDRIWRRLAATLRGALRRGVGAARGERR